MFGSAVLETAIGIVLVYLLLSLVASAIQEGIAGWLKLRASTLERGMRELLHAPELVEAVYEHPLVSALYTGTYAQARAQRTLPSYIPAANFARALMDLAVRGRDLRASAAASGSAPVLSLASLRANVGRLADPPTQRVLLTAIDTAQGDLQRAQANIEAWFDSTMDRVSGWYKRRTQWILLVIALVLTVAVDADSIRIVNRLYADPGLRAGAVALASRVTADSATLRTAPGTALGELASLQLPIGWPRYVDAWPDYGRVVGGIGLHVLHALVGWLLTAFALSLGAPFWFDVLNRFMVVRATVKPHQKSPEEGSEDRQDAAPAAPPATGAAGMRARPAAAPAVAAGGVEVPDDWPPGFTPQEWASGHAQEGVL